MQKYDVELIVWVQVKDRSFKTHVALLFMADIQFHCPYLGICSLLDTNLPSPHHLLTMAVHRNLNIP